MELKIKADVPCALALEGGGARGSYQIGAWRAIREAGVHIAAVSGASVGALNGAMIAMGDLERAEEIWRSVHYSKVIEAEDEIMAMLRGELKGLDLRAAVRQVGTVLHNRGFHAGPLYNWIKQVVSEPQLRGSDTELYIVTYSVSEQKKLELRARDLADGEIYDMLLASAYMPIFKSEKLGGKRYLDGGWTDAVPVNVLVKNGYENIIVVRLLGPGVRRPVRIPAGTEIHTVVPRDNIGGMLDFDGERSVKNMTLGYYDTKRVLYGLKGDSWYIDSRWSEREAYEYLMHRVRQSSGQLGFCPTLRQIHEKILPALSRRLSAGRDDYLSIAAAYLEQAAKQAGAERMSIYTEKELAAIAEGNTGPDPLTEETAAAAGRRRIFG